MTVQEMVSLRKGQMHKLAAVIVAVVAVVLAFISIRGEWYHIDREDSYPTVGEVYGDETQFSLDGLYSIDGGGRDFWSFEQGRNFWEPLEPIHSFMEKLQILLTAGSVSAALWAILVFPDRRVLSTVAGVASAALFGISPLMFYLGFESVYTRTGLPGYQPDFKGFFVNIHEADSISVHSEVWGPMAGWWMAIVACFLMVAGLVSLAVLRRRESRKGPGTRLSRSP